MFDDLRDAMWYPGIRIGVFRRSFDELAESIMPVLESVGYGEALGARWNKNDRELRFPNGSVVRYRYLENLEDASRRQGGGYQKLSIDERTQIVPGGVDRLSERLRTRIGSGIPVLGIRSTSNPGGADHGGVKERYIVATNYGERVYTDDHGQTVRFIPATVDDNPHVNVEYKLQLDSIPDPQRRAAMRHGSWDSFSGQVFSEWNRDRHIVTPWLLPAMWDRTMAVDWGYTAPWAVVWAAVDEDGRAWVYRELYATLVGEHDQAQRIIAAENDGRAASPDGEVPEPEPYRVGDPAMFAKRGDAEAISTAYADEGVDLEPAINDRLAGWARIHTFLAEGPACNHHRSLGWTQCPMLHVFSGCEHLIRTLPSLPYSTTRVEDADTKAEDHAPDALRYLLMAIGGDARFAFPEDPIVKRLAIDGETSLREVIGPYAWDPDDLKTPYNS